MEKDESNSILAAGAILWRGRPFASEIAIIHRTRHGDEWCLPKGKYDKYKDNGSLENTALREVKEETGYDGKTLYFADVISYKHKGKKKQVFFWHMQLIEESIFKPTDETDQLIWLPPEIAIKIMTHKDQKKLIIEMHSVVKYKYKPNLFNWFKSPRYKRLHGSLLSYKNELEQRIINLKNNINENSGWIVSIRKLLNEADNQLNKSNYDAGWKCFHTAQRMEIYGLIPIELNAKASIIRYEAEKLNEWRRKAIYQLLGTPDTPINMPDCEQVYQAALLRDEHYNNQAYKQKLIWGHLGSLVIIIFLIGISLVVLFKLGIIPFGCSTDNISCNCRLMPGIILFGVLGGAFSATLKIPSSVQSTRIPELTHSFRLTILRVFIGGVSAYIIFLFLKSDIAGNIFNLSNNILNVYTFYAIAFAAGFSERMVLKAMEVVSKEK